MKPVRSFPGRVRLCRDTPKDYEARTARAAKSNILHSFADGRQLGATGRTTQVSGGIPGRCIFRRRLQGLLPLLLLLLLRNNACVTCLVSKRSPLFGGGGLLRVGSAKALARVLVF